VEEIAELKMKSMTSSAHQDEFVGAKGWMAGWVRIRIKRWRLLLLHRARRVWNWTYSKSQISQPSGPWICLDNKMLRILIQWLGMIEVYLSR